MHELYFSLEFTLETCKFVHVFTKQFDLLLFEEFKLIDRVIQIDDS